MTILETVHYNNYDAEHRVPGWARSERYEYCDEFFNRYTGEKDDLLDRLAKALRKAD